MSGPLMKCWETSHTITADSASRYNLRPKRGHADKEIIQLSHRLCEEIRCGKEEAGKSPQLKRSCSTSQNEQDLWDDGEDELLVQQSQIAEATSKLCPSPFKMRNVELAASSRPGGSHRVLNCPPASSSSVTKGRQHVNTAADPPLGVLADKVNTCTKDTSTEQRCDDQGLADDAMADILKDIFENDEGSWEEPKPPVLPSKTQTEACKLQLPESSEINRPKPDNPSDDMMSDDSFLLPEVETLLIKIDSQHMTQKLSESAQRRCTQEEIEEKRKQALARKKKRPR